MKLDIKDKKLLYELGLNSRKSIRELAKKLNFSKSTVNYRIQRLLKNKIISGFKTYVNYSKLGMSQFALYLKLQNTGSETENKIINYFLSKKQVTWVGGSYGNWELIVEFLADGFLDLTSFLSDFYQKYSSNIQEKELVQYINENLFGYKFLKVKNYPSMFVEFVGEKAALDNLDKKIVKYIIENPDYNLYLLASDLSISLHIARTRIKKLIENKIIAGYSIQLNPAALGLGSYIVQVSLRDYSHEKEFMNFLQKNPNVHYSIKYLGKWDYEIGLYVKNSSELEKFISELKRDLPGLIKNYEFSLITKLHRVR